MQTEKITAIHADNQIQILSGMVESIDEEKHIRILGHDGHTSATMAFSCLVEPIANDVVLYSINERLECHVLSVIERPDSNTTSLAFPGDVVFKAANGKLNLHAKQNLDISSEREINMVTEEYSLMSKKALFSIDNLRTVGSTLVSNIKNVCTFSESIESVADRLVQKLKSSIRMVEGTDQTKARDVITTVKNLYTLRSRQSAILAKKDMKIDAERIHMG